jgi:FMN phosphatase YigB (HAD superfamily)
MHVKAVIFDLDGTITQPCLDFSLIRREMGMHCRKLAVDKYDSIRSIEKHCDLYSEILRQR